MSGASTVFHLVLDLFDLDEVSRIERKGRIVAVAFVCAEASVGNTLTPGFHRRRVPELRKVPVVFAKVRNRVEDLAARYGAFIVNYGARAACPALKLRTAFECGPCDQFVHVYIDRRF